MPPEKVFAKLSFRSQSPTNRRAASIRAGPLAPGDPVEHGVQLHVLARRQLAVQAGVLEHDAEGAARGEGRFLRVVAGKQDRPLRGRQGSRQHLDGGRLARAVGTEKPEDFPGFNLEGDIIDGAKVLECLHQVGGDDDLVLDHVICMIFLSFAP